MPEISIDRIKMQVPDSVVTTEELLKMCHADKGDVPYLIDGEGNHAVLVPGQHVEVEDGTRFGTVTRFITAGDRGRADR
jgi:hypothetical protein